MGACGGGLYDATGVPRIGGGGDVCGLDQVSCGGQCAAQGPSVCGVACEDCTATGTPPSNGVRDCLRDGGAPGTCGYVCTGGFLKCAAGCCGTTALAAGDRFTCARLDDGEIACWGANDFGQVGDGSTSAATPAPHLVPLGASASAVGAGASHACAVVQGGAVRCWGSNEAGQVTGTPSALPVLSPAAAPVTSNAVAVAAGASHTCALLGTGAVVCWGSNTAGQLGPGPGQPIASGATEIAVGRQHACAVVAGGVRCWGSNSSGQLGASPTGGIAIPIASGIQHLGAGADQTCAATGTSGVTTPDDALRCWGDSVGPGWMLASPQTTPAVPMKDATTPTVRYDVTVVVAGAHHVCVMKKTEQVQCLGANERGQLGNGLTGPGETALVPLPAAVAPAPIAVSLAAGASHGCAALGDGRLRCWGANDAGQLGDGNSGPDADPGLGILATPLGR